MYYCIPLSTTIFALPCYESFLTFLGMNLSDRVPKWEDADDGTSLGGTSTQKHVRHPTPLVRKKPMEITLQMGGGVFDPELIIYN